MLKRRRNGDEDEILITSESSQEPETESTESLYYYVCGQSNCGNCTMCGKEVSPDDVDGGICESCDNLTCGDCMTYVITKQRGHKDKTMTKCTHC
jgi:hypothetical protein